MMKWAKRASAAMAAALLTLAILPAPSASATISSTTSGDVELRNLALGMEYTYSETPNSAWPDSGGELTDGKYAGSEFWNPGWVGHLRGKSRSIVFDLGDKKSIGDVKAHFMQDTGSGIFYPTAVSFYVSNDGNN